MKKFISSTGRWGCRSSLEQIEITDAQWQECMERIPAMSDIAHYPYRVTKEMLGGCHAAAAPAGGAGRTPGMILPPGKGKIFRWSGGFCGYVRPGASGQGYFQKLTEAIKKVVSLPVILTGGITEPGAAEALLQNGKADLIGVGRGHPEGFFLGQGSNPGLSTGITRERCTGIGAAGLERGYIREKDPVCLPRQGLLFRIKSLKSS